MLSKKLGQICKLRQGFQVPVDRQITECKEGYVRFIRIVDYTQKTDDIRYVLDDEKFYYVKPDDVVMVRYGAAGEVGHGISGVIANNMFLIDPVMDINKDYLFYYLSQAKVKNKLLSASSSTTMPALNFKIVNDLDIPIWSRESQDDIVKHLDKIKGIISKRREELTKLDELVKARFVEMFVEKGYPLKKVHDVLETAFWLMPATPEFIIDGEVPYITSKNIKNRKIDFENVKYISRESYFNISSNRPTQIGDILVSMIGTLGQTAVITDDRLFYGQNLYLLRLDNSIIDTDYFCEFFNSDLTQHELQGQRNQSTQAYLKANHVEGLTIPMPPLAKQKQFAAFVQQVDKSKVAVQKSLDEAQLLFDSLMQQYFG